MSKYDVDLREVLEHHEHWHEHTTTMCMPLRTFLAVGLTICTAGWGPEYVAAHYANASTAVARSVGAALEGITNTFIVSTLANGGDFGKVFKEITDSRYLKGLVASALASGLVSKFIDTPLADKAKTLDDKRVLKAVSDAETGGAAGVHLVAEDAAVKSLDFGARLDRNLRAAAITAVVSSAVCGGKVGKTALSSWGGAAVDTVSAHLAREIGARYNNGEGDMAWLTHKVCHFVLGGTSGALKGDDLLSAGVGATVGEIVADAMIQCALEQTRTEVR